MSPTTRSSLALIAAVSLAPLAARADEPAGASAAPAPAAEEKPLAGYAGSEQFFLRSADDNFVLIPSGRMQFDGFYFPTPTATTPKSDLFVKRARAEVAGTFMKKFDFMLAGDFAGSSLPAYTDDWVNVALDPLFNIQIGQYDIPFTNENRTSDKYLDFQERSIAVRALGIPENKGQGIMAWALAKDKAWHYSVMVFDGDGQQTRNKDSAFDWAGRAFVQPFKLMGYEGPGDRFQIGASGYTGFHHKTGLDGAKWSTQGGFTFLNANGSVTDSAKAKHAVQLAGEGRDERHALEVSVPFGDLELQAEFVGVEKDIAEISDGKGTGSNGRYSAKGLYVEVGYWLFGGRGVIGPNGVQAPAHLNLSKAAPTECALEVVAKVESAQADISLKGSSLTTIPGHYEVNAFQIGLNYWATKHLRLSGDYAFYNFGGQSTTPDKGVTQENELLFRAAVAL